MANIESILGGAFVPPKPVTKPTEPPEAQFRNAMIDAGLEPPDQIIVDGALHRFKSSGNKQFDRSGWYVAHMDGFPTITFGDWRQGIDHTFKADIGRKITVAEEMENLARIQKAKAMRDEERQKKNELTASTVETIWQNGTPATTEHPYLKKKMIQPHGAKVTGDGRLMLPLYGDDGSLATLQYIDAEGNKLYHSGGATKAKFAMIGSMDEPGILYIAEGYATAATIHEATNRPCVVAYSASNLVPVTETMRNKYGIGQDIMIVADNDKSGIGQRYAEQSAAKYGARFVMPDMDGDANDYALAGHDLKLLLKPTANNEIIGKMQAIFANELSDDYRPPNELIENLMTIGGLTVLYGDSNSGKTFLALSLAAAVATGSNCYGRQTDKGLVIYLATESPSSVMTRIQAIKKHTDQSLENLIVVPVPINFYSGDGDAHDVVELVKAVTDAKGMPVHLIVGDTLARMSAGANENSGEDMGPVMARFDQVANATGAAMLIIHHTGKNAAAGARGWSGIRAHIDTEIEVIVEGDTRMANVTKQRELPGKGDAIYFKLEIIEMGKSKFGNIATTCVAVPDEDGAISKKKIIKSRADKFYNELVDAWFFSNCETLNNDPYITRSGLKFYFEKQGKSNRTIENKLNSSRENDFIYTLLNEDKISVIKDGWIIIDDLWVSDMMLRRKK